MDSQSCVFLGIKVKPGPIERHKLDNFSLDHTVNYLKNEVEKKINFPSSSLELIHHGKILKGEATLQDSGVKSGEMIHVVKKKVQNPTPPPVSFSDAELQQLNASLRTLGCTPNAPGWTRAMQLLNEESTMNEILEQAPSLHDDCVAMSILHEVELVAALGANLQSMRRGADAHPALPHALRHLMRLVRSSSNTNTTDNVPTSGFAYSLEALSDDEEAEEEESEEGERNPITQEQLAAALQAATEAVSSGAAGGVAGAGGAAGAGLGGAGQESTAAMARRMIRAARSVLYPAVDGSGSGSGSAGRAMITPEMVGDAISEAIGRAATAAAPAAATAATAAAANADRAAPAAASSSSGSEPAEFARQLEHMHEMGLLDDALNVRALLICAGDVNAAINLVFSGAIGDE